MRISLDGTTYVINWKYQPADEDFASVDTICRLSRVIDDKNLEPLHMGVAKCSVFDRFEKEKGRKISMTRAIYMLDRAKR